ncbi:hypothetical protein EON66_06060 [archaeon]|nr:MAG: hypothetical protein EON66_06060 [archaeon]
MSTDEGVFVFTREYNVPPSWIAVPIALLARARAHFTHGTTMQQPTNPECSSESLNAPSRAGASPIISEFGSTSSWWGAQDSKAQHRDSAGTGNDSSLQRGASCLTCRVTGSVVFAGVAVYLLSEMRHVPTAAKGHRLMLGGMAAAAAAASIARALY